MRLGKRWFPSLVAASRILSSPFNAFSRLRVQVADNCPEFPLGHRPFLRNLRHDMGVMPPCSAPSSVLRRCQTARPRPCKNYGHRPSLTVPPCNTTGAAELSRFSNIERRRLPIMEPLLLLCGALSPPPLCRFIPALSQRPSGGFPKFFRFPLDRKNI